MSCLHFVYFWRLHVWPWLSFRAVPLRNLAIQSLKINNVIEEKDIFSIIGQILDCGYTLELPLLTSVHNLCFGTTVRKIGLPIKPPDLL